MTAGDILSDSHGCRHVCCVWFSSHPADVGSDPVYGDPERAEFPEEVLEVVGDE